MSKFELAQQKLNEEKANGLQEKAHVCMAQIWVFLTKFERPSHDGRRREIKRGKARLLSFLCCEFFSPCSWFQNIHAAVSCASLASLPSSLFPVDQSSLLPHQLASWRKQRVSILQHT
jgi:hypothetical protein